MNKIILCLGYVTSVMGTAAVVCTDDTSATKCTLTNAVCGYIKAPSTDPNPYLLRRVCSAAEGVAPTADELKTATYENWTYSATKPSATTSYKTADAQSMVVGATTSLLAVLYLI